MPPTSFARLYLSFSTGKALALGAQARTTSPSPRTWRSGGDPIRGPAGRFTAAPGPAPAPGKVGKGGPKTTERTQRYKCPVHHGKKPSVAVGYIGDRAWAKCWSHGCPSKDILAALNLSNSQSIPWTPPPPKRSRPTLSIKPLTPVSHTQALDYLFGIRHPKALESLSTRRRPKVVAIGVTRTSGATQASLATAGNCVGLTRLIRPQP